MRIDTLKTFDLILSLSKDEDTSGGCGGAPGSEI